MKALLHPNSVYCHLIKMLHNRTLNNRINKDHSVTVHHKNLQVLVTEIFKVKKDLATDISEGCIDLKELPYNLRSESNHFTRRNVQTNY